MTEATWALAAIARSTGLFQETVSGCILYYAVLYYILSYIRCYILHYILYSILDGSDMQTPSARYLLAALASHLLAPSRDTTAGPPVIFPS